MLGLIGSFYRLTQFILERYFFEYFYMLRTFFVGENRVDLQRIQFVSAVDETTQGINATKCL